MLALRTGTPLVILLLIAAQGAAQEDTRPRVDKYLTEGKLAEGHEALARHLEAHPDDSQARYALGVVEILRAVERFSQSLYRYGLRTDAPEVPFLRLDVPSNKDPERITYAAMREVFRRLIADLEQAEQTLAGVKDVGVKLTLPVGKIRLDLDGNGEATEGETFWRIFTSVALRARKIDLTEEQKTFPISFDAADAHWMRGYSHLLRAMAEAYLAHDSEDFFNATAHVFFAGARPPHPELWAQDKDEGDGLLKPNRIVDLAAAIHLFRFEPKEPGRMKKAHRHLLAMIGQSRRCWDLAVKEADDDREWIPNARQTSLVPLEVDEQQVEGWRRFLDEFEAILKGEKLVPHWRLAEGHGVNIRKVFHEPRPLDLVMWVHGAAALPYLEKGEATDQETWRRLQRTFGGNFLAFAVWFQ